MITSSADGTNADRLKDAGIHLRAWRNGLYGAQVVPAQRRALAHLRSAPVTDLASPDAGLLAGADDASLADQLVQLVRVMHAFKAAHSATGSGPEARERTAHVLLFPLTRLGPLRQGALAELVHADPSTVSRHVALLVDRGLVRRVADEQDGRASRLVVTPAGAAVVDQMRQEWDAVLRRVTSDWAPDELAVFTRQLGRFVRGLSEHIPTVGAAAGCAGDLPEKDR
jgi:DNA-binding MarR family transcriptional regulator